MKKVFITLAALASFATLQAQDFKPTSGKVALELNMASPFSSATPFSLISGFKGRFFISDLIAVRAGLNWNSSSTTTPTFLLNGTDKVENTNKSSTFSITPGIEKHFEGTDRLSPYVGAILPITFASSESVSFSGASATNNTKTTVTNQNGYTSFGLGLISGADFYIAKSLYLGVEFGLTFATSSDKETVTTYSVTGGPAKDDVKVEGGSSFNISSVANGAFRIGYWF